MADAWEQAFMAELQGHCVEAVNPDRSETEDESDSLPSTQYSEFWWHEDLLLALHSCDRELPQLEQPVEIVSCCTGCCAEGEVFKAAGVKNVSQSLSPSLSQVRSQFGYVMCFSVPCPQYYILYTLHTIFWHWPGLATPLQDPVSIRHESRFPCLRDRESRRGIVCHA